MASNDKQSERNVSHNIYFTTNFFDMSSLNSCPSNKLFENKVEKKSERLNNKIFDLHTHEYISLFENTKFKENRKANIVSKQNLSYISSSVNESSHDDITSIVKQISDDAEIIYKNWIACGFAPLGILHLKAQPSPYPVSKKKSEYSTTDLLTRSPKMSSSDLKEIVKSFISEDKARRSNSVTIENNPIKFTSTSLDCHINTNESEKSKSCSNSIKEALCKFESINRGGMQIKINTTPKTSTNTQIIQSGFPKLESNISKKLLTDSSKSIIEKNEIDIKPNIKPLKPVKPDNLCIAIQKNLRSKTNLGKEFSKKPNIEEATCIQFVLNQDNLSSQPSVSLELKNSNDSHSTKVGVRKSNYKKQSLNFIESEEIHKKAGLGKENHIHQNPSHLALTNSANENNQLYTAISTNDIEKNESQPNLKSLISTTNKTNDNEEKQKLKLNENMNFEKNTQKPAHFPLNEIEKYENIHLSLEYKENKQKFEDNQSQMLFNQKKSNKKITILSDNDIRIKAGKVEHLYVFDNEKVVRSNKKRIEECKAIENIANSSIQSMEFLSNKSVLSNKKQNFQSSSNKSTSIKLSPKSGCFREMVKYNRGINPVQPFLTRGSVAERIMMFEKCPDKITTSFKQINKEPPEKFKPKLHAIHVVSEKPDCQSHTTLQRAVRSSNVKSLYIPRFYYPHGKPLPNIAQETIIQQIKAAFDNFPNNQCSKLNFHKILKLCNIPFYWRMPFISCTQIMAGSLIDGYRFVDFWKQMCVYCHDFESKFVYVLSRGQRSRPYIVPEDLTSLIQDVVDTHPGLAFLKDASEFHSRYIHTVISRIFYSVNRSWTNRITVSELKRSNLLQVIQLLEDEDDINQIMAFFSYEHFYVIYCKFWELDRDHDLFIDQNDLAQHNNHALSTRIIERIFSGCVTRGNKMKNADSKEQKQMSYTEFVWFLLAEEDKTNSTSIEYWFRCMDLDGDGIISMYELEYFYEEQQERMFSLGIETLPFEDCLCQMLDMIKPHKPGRITLGDLKRCKMTSTFFDTFFNLIKYLEYEQRDPFVNQKENDDMCDWDRYASQEYELLVAEENDVLGSNEEDTYDSDSAYDIKEVHLSKR